MKKMTATEARATNGGKYKCMCWKKNWLGQKVRCGSIHSTKVTMGWHFLTHGNVDYYYVIA